MKQTLNLYIGLVLGTCIYTTGTINQELKQ